MQVMRAEIREQPDAVARALENAAPHARQLAQLLRDRATRHVVIAARGTSDNAATYARYLLEIALRVPVGLAAPSVYTLYKAEVDLRDALVLGISQSGVAPDVIEVLAAARAQGAVTACITNDEQSPIASQGHIVLPCSAGPEKAVAATKTYTTSLALIALLAAEWKQDDSLRHDLLAIPTHIEATLGLEAEMDALAAELADLRECVVLARGINLATAQEVALKLTETNYLAARPFSAADFRHGPIAAAGKELPCFLFAAPGAAYSDVLDLACELERRGSPVVLFTSGSPVAALGRRLVRLPGSVVELLSPLLTVVPGQLLAASLATVKGNDADSPRGLHKVTRTR
ncbi:MAG: SIS domain-containing protein [Armatimonadetes bacterium]|nr:SIS domain-containing protein [Armatimonadota bacterium]MDE2207707.1 SIS domain-containing protein [Armatimonadota bacterium]